MSGEPVLACPPPPPCRCAPTEPFVPVPGERYEEVAAAPAWGDPTFVVSHDRYRPDPPPQVPLPESGALIVCAFALLALSAWLKREGKT